MENVFSRSRVGKRFVVLHFWRIGNDDQKVKLMERRMLGVTLRDKKTAALIREQTRVAHITLEIKRNKQAWAEHVMRA